jgi:hypothetical protein
METTTDDDAPILNIGIKEKLQNQLVTATDPQLRMMIQQELDSLKLFDGSNAFFEGAIQRDKSRRKVVINT